MVEESFTLRPMGDILKFKWEVELLASIIVKEIGGIYFLRFDRW